MIEDTILVVDDNPTNLSLLFEALKRAGFKVRAATNGRAALESISHLKPDMILLDVMMPGMTGFETCERIKADEATRSIPVIFMTVLDGVVDEMRGFEAGAVDYITKPIQVQTVVARIKTHLMLQRLQRELQAQNKQLKEEGQRRQRALEALKESRANYRFLAENATDIISRQSPDGRYIYVSPSVQAVLGYEVHEIAGHYVEDFFHPDDWAVLQADRPWYRVSPLTYRALTKDGRYIWLETVHKVIEERKKGQVVEIVGVSRDVTERKEIEAAVQQRNQELDAFAHTVAHDLKNPLSTVIGYVDLALEMIESLGKPEIQVLLKKVKRAGYQGIGIIESLLLLAGVRKGQVDPVPVDMGAITAQVEARLYRMISDYEAEVIWPDTWPVALGYGPWLEEVWVNYMSNALKYGGRPPRVALGADVSEGLARFWVMDNGPGISAEDQASLFTEFIRLSEVEIEGHGLGLSIVRRIVEKLGGTVGVESEPGVGSRFWFTLPVP